MTRCLSLCEIDKRIFRKTTENEEWKEQRERRRNITGKMEDKKTRVDLDCEKRRGEVK